MGYYLTKQCKDPKEALRLLRYLSDRWESSGAKLPPRRSVYESEAYEDAVGEQVLNVVKARADRLMMIPADSGGALEQVGGAYIAAVKQAIAEDVDPASLLSEAQAQVRTAFQEP